MITQKIYRKRAIWASIFGLISLSVIAMFVFLFYSQTEKNIFSDCEAIEYRPDRHSCSKDAALYLLQNGGSIKDLYKFMEPFAAATSTLRRSHFMDHAIGKAALIVSNYNLVAARDMCLPNCAAGSAGFYHGLVQEWGEYAPSSISEYMDFLSSFCNTWEAGHEACSPHNIGHAYMSLEGGLSESIMLCDDQQDDDIFNFCYNGAVHQYILNGGGGDIFEGCANLAGRKKIACYSYGSWYYTKIAGSNLNVEDKIENCNIISKKIPPGLNYCFDRIGLPFRIKGKILDLTLCENVDSSLKELCVKGLTAPDSFALDDGLATCNGGEVSENGSLGCEL